MTITSEQQEYDAWLLLLGKTVAEIRKSRKLTQSQMAQKTDFDMKYYQDIEYGRRPLTTRTLFKLCSGMGVTVQDLINLVEKKKLTK